MAKTEARRSPVFGFRHLDFFRHSSFAKHPAALRSGSLLQAVEN